MINWMISSSCLILIVLMVRRLFAGKISLRLQYALWFLVAVRLLIPINLGSSVISIENFTNHLSDWEHITESIENDVQELSDQHYAESIKIYDSIEEIRNEETENLQESEPLKEQLEVVPQNAPFQAEGTKKEISNADILMGIWMTGMVLFGFVFLLSNLIFDRKLKKSRNLLENTYGNLPVYESAEVDTPCLFGILHPTIYVTESVVSDKEIFYHAVVHEQSHYEMGDIFWSFFRCICLILHWYNPLVWWAAKISKQDAELASDEMTIQKLGEEERLAYGKTLIQLTCEKRQELFIAATTMVSEKKSIKERVQYIAQKTKMKRYALICIGIAAAIAVGCTFTGAQNEEKKEEIPAAPVRGIPCEDPETGGWEIEEIYSGVVSKAEKIIERVNINLREGYQDAKLTYVDNAEVGWNYYVDNPWSTEEQRDELAQAALKELYTLTGYNVTECTYTTDGRSRFIFGKNAGYIRKCIAFYSRDYGFTLCGDSVPYQGFLNARKFHYSDVQQLDSPYGKEEYSGHAGVPTWYLEHSGVYQGEYISGYEAINLDDTVYTHVKLTFDGGYYIVVMNEAIESCSEVMGPYYEMKKDTSVYHEVSRKNQVCLAVMPDGISQAGGDYRYIIPENQEDWIKAYKEMYALSAGNGRWREDERSMGIWIVYNDVWTCLTDQGFLVNFSYRTERSDAQEFYDLCLNEAKKHGINEPVRPEEIKNLVQAMLSLEDGMYLLSDEKSLFELQKAFSISQEIRGGAACPFTAVMSLKNEDGEIKNIYLAADSCDTWLSSGVYYQYPGFEDIEELRSYFNDHGTEISSAMSTFRGDISVQN